MGNLALTIRGGLVQAHLASSEAALREGEHHFRALADARTVLIRTSGLDRGCDYVNQPWLRFTGRGLEQELGLGWVEMVHPEDQALCLETYAKAFDRRGPFGIEYRLRRADGEYRWIRDDGSPRHDSQGAFWATSTIATTSPSAGWRIPLRPALKSGWSCQRAL